MKIFGVLQLTIAWGGLIYAFFGDKLPIIPTPAPGASFAYAMVSGLIGIMGAVFFVGAEIASALRQQLDPSPWPNRKSADLSPAMK